MKNKQKIKNNGAFAVQMRCLCRANAVPLPCKRAPCARQRRHLRTGLVSWGRGVAVRVGEGRTAKKKALPCGARGRTAKNMALPCGERVGARQRKAGRQRGGRTAKQRRTAKRGSTRRSVGRTAKALPCSFGEAHGSVAFTEPDVAERPLPCDGARQSLSRAKYSLCCAK